MPDTEPAAWERITQLADYEVIDADLAQACDHAVAVWSNSIGWPGRQAEMYRRYYLECPVGQPRMKFLRHVPSGAIVGTLGVGPRRVRWRGRDIRAGVLSHFCVVKAHRKLRPPMLLVSKAVAACRGDYDLVYAMPGTPRAAALGRLFGGAPACHVLRRVKVLRHGKYAARWLPRPAAALAGAVVDAAMALRRHAQRGGRPLRGEWMDRVDPGMSALWRESAASPRWSAARDVSMLRWRFDRLPARRRRHLLVHDAREGSLVAWFACDDNFFDPDILVVHDFWAVGGPAAIGRAAIRVLCAAARDLGFSAVETRLAAGAAAAAWLAEGFSERNRYPVYMAWLNASLAPPTHGELRFTELDNDG